MATAVKLSTYRSKRNFAKTAEPAAPAKLRLPTGSNSLSKNMTPAGCIMICAWNSMAYSSRGQLREARRSIRMINA